MHGRHHRHGSGDHGGGHEPPLRGAVRAAGRVLLAARRRAAAPGFRDGHAVGFAPRRVQCLWTRGHIARPLLRPRLPGRHVVARVGRAAARGRPNRGDHQPQTLQRLRTAADRARSRYADLLKWRHGAGPLSGRRAWPPTAGHRAHRRARHAPLPARQQGVGRRARLVALGGGGREQPATRRRFRTLRLGCRARRRGGGARLQAPLGAARGRVGRRRLNRLRGPERGAAAVVRLASPVRAPAAHRAGALPRPALLRARRPRRAPRRRARGGPRAALRL
mmetsp:Transcript_6709/g.17505  ORF Transcript_6709/g.17505 Transcript_6709/m.17505 type:complete len:278 (-) Transcript_6709:800-1633(-)